MNAADPHQTHDGLQLVQRAPQMPRPISEIRAERDDDRFSGGRR
jgi:hypothetical protein